MSNIMTQELGYDDPSLLERMAGLVDRGYVVYFGELATAALASDTEVPDGYYALVVREREHEEDLLTANNVYEAAHALRQVKRDIYWIPEEPFVPIRRFTEQTILHDKKIQTADTADMALAKAVRSLRESEENPVSRKFIRPARLRQSHTQCRR